MALMLGNTDLLTVTTTMKYELLVALAHLGACL